MITTVSNFIMSTFNIFLFCKVVGWIPEVYEKLKELPEEMPQDLKDIITEKTIQNGLLVPKVCAYFLDLFTALSSTTFFSTVSECNV